MLGPVAAALTAATGPVAGLDPVTSWLVAQGTLGVVCGLLWFALRKESARADTERARADANAEKFIGVIERVLPALADSTRAVQEQVEQARRDRDR